MSLLKNKRLDIAFILGFIAKTGTAFTGITIVMLLTRLLSVEDMATYFLIFQAIKFLAIACTIGLHKVVQKQVGIYQSTQDKINNNNITVKIFSLMTAANVAIASAFIWGWPYLNKYFFNDQIPLVWGAAIFFIGYFRSIELISSSFYRAKRKYMIGLSLLGFPRDALILITLLCAIKFSIEVSIENIIAVFLIVSLFIIAFSSSRLFVRALLGTRDRDRIKDNYRSLLSLSIPMYLHSLSSVIYTTSDLWILGIFGSPIEVANYGAATRMVSILLFVLSIINFIIPSIISSNYAKGLIDNVETVARGGATIVIFFAIPIVLTFAFYGEDLLAILFGEAYKDGYLYLYILSIGAFVSSFVGSPGVILQMTGHHKLLTRITVSVVILNLACCIYAAQHFGGIGIAFVTSGSMVVQNISMALAVYFKVGIISLPLTNKQKISKFFKIAKSNA